MSDRRHDAEFEGWKERAKASAILPTAERLGAKLKRMGGTEWAGPCPRCGGEDRFAIRPSEGVFLCRGSGGGDVIKMVEHVNSIDFMEACEWLNGEPPPGRDRRPLSEAEKQERAERRTREDQERADREAAQAATAARKDRSTLEKCLQLFESRRPLLGSRAAAYLSARGIGTAARFTTDFGFVAALEYWGYPDEKAEEQKLLGRFDAMIAAMRKDGEIAAVHRTYFDPEKPRKLDPPGDKKRNMAKKVLGKARGTVIQIIDPDADHWLIGEGIETSASADILGLGRGGESDDRVIGVAAAYSLGNMAGRCTGTVPHPTKPGQTICNSIPDADDPGLIYPAHVRSIGLLMDRDSDLHATAAQIRAALRRAQAQGKTGFVHAADEGMDFNAQLMATLSP